MAHGQVLVVDDDDDARVSVVEFLEQAQVSVVTARNGRDALDMLRRGTRPALILLDLHMPVMDGWELARIVTSDPHLRELPICIVSGADPSDGIPSQVVAVLRKPMQMTALLAVVYQHC